MGTLSQDLRYALRGLWKSPSFALVSVIVLALGIGANTAIFSVVNAVVLRPLPYKDPETLVAVWETMPGNDERSVAPGNFADWRIESRAFEQLAAYSSAALNLTSDGDPERLSGAAVTPNFFDTLGVAPALGRALTPEDGAREEAVVVLGHGLWQRRFGADARAVGRTLTLDGKPYEVVGVMPQGFAFPERAELWVAGQRGSAVPPSLSAQFPESDLAASRDIHIYSAVGRLRAGVTSDEARAELSAVMGRLADEHPDTNEGLGANVVPLHRQLVGDVRATLYILLGAVALVLLIACTNVANLLLARATRRERELAIRIALGAGRARLVRQMLTESLLLSLAGGALGLLVALWGIDLFVSLSPGDIPRLGEVGLDARLLGFTLVVSLATGVGFGLLPALQATRLDPQIALREGGAKATEGRRRRRARNLLVVSEIALAQLLLVGAGLLMLSFLRLQAVNPGFDAENVLTARVALPPAKYGDTAKKVAFYDAVLERLRALPGVRSAGLVMNLPLGGSRMNRGFVVEGRPEARADENVTVDYQVVSRDYFETMRIPVRSGRGFTDADTPESPRAALVSESMARKYFPGEDPVGKRIAFGDAKRAESWRTIVGVVGDVRHASMDAQPFPGAYTLYGQDKESWSRVAFVVRTEADPKGLAAAVRREILAVDPQQPVSNIQTMEETLSASIKRPRFVTALLGVLASVALALAVVGIYGLMSYTVTERTHEIGVRMALGAQTRDVLRLIVGEGLWLTVAGVGCGLVGALILTRLMSKLLYGVSATDAATFAAVSLVLATVALVACFIPARRATKVDPMVALRYE
ncbi:MAG TPA: ABC transporter permease [Pyrinomonadaceae bacterium]|nr:ABC transporter permease [Pyrinomonadaceae bacterium]